MRLSDEEWAMVYAAMKVADAIVLEVTLSDSTSTGDVVMLWHPERVQAVITAKQELRDVSELPYKWKKLMSLFNQTFGSK